MTTHEVLVKARALIEREEDWQCEYAEDVDRGPHCAVSAIDGCRSRSDGAEVRPIAALAWAMGISRVAGGAVGGWNDSHSHAEGSRWAFDRAIAATAPEPDVSFLDEVSVVTAA
jgi:hypothetical protein